MTRRLIAISGFCVLVASTAGADEKLALLIPGVYGPQGLFVESEALLPSGETHSALSLAKGKQGWSIREIGR